MQLKESAKKKAHSYIGSRIAGENKMESAIQAGYSETVARKPSIIEGTKAYNLVYQQVLEENSQNMLRIMEDVTESLTKEPKDLVRAKLASETGKNLTAIYTALMPKVTLKESTDKNGNVTRTAWAQNASQVQEVLEDKE